MNSNEIILTFRRYKEKNQNKYKIIRIGIFGSAARGTMQKQSDIDVVVELEKQDLFNIIGIKQDLEEQFQQAVDIVSYRKNMNEFLKRRIDNEAAYV